VISGFRVGPGGAAAHYGITPDLATFGKIIGGGLPVGAFGGTRRIMAHIAPEGGVYQAGTLSGNPVAMAAGATTLAILQRDSVWAQLEELGGLLEHKMTPVLANAPMAVGQVRLGSLAWFFFQEGKAPRAAAAVDSAAGTRFAPVFHALLERGMYVAPSAYEVLFLSSAHTPQHIAQFADAFGAALQQAAKGERP